MTDLLRIEALNVHLGESHILHGLSLAVPEGGVTALLGRNGAGKTTTIRSVLGLAPGRGSIRLDGTELIGLRTHAIVRLGVGYVPEDREIFSDLTVSENLALAVRDSAPRHDLVYELFGELQERGEQRAGSLSGGQQQMLALGRALLNRNRLILVDEPTKGLSPLMVTKVTEALRRAALESTVLLVEQNLQVARDLAQRVIVLDQGAVVFEGPAERLMSDPDLARRHLGVSEH